MNTITPVFIPVSSGHTEDPKCPHCKEKLRGWTEPSTTTWKEAIVGIVVIGAILLTLAGTLFGFMSSMDLCDPAFSKRYHYLMPTFPYACISGRWLVNKEELTTRERAVSNCADLAKRKCKFDFYQYKSFGQPSCLEDANKECMDGFEKDGNYRIL